MKKENKLEKKHNIRFNDKDYVDTTKYDNYSLEELNKMIEKEKENYNKYLKEKEKTSK